jgi:predicted tellurium resistance membrane protein TerC
MLNDLIALVALSAMEIVLGIDNIVFISVVTSRLPLQQQKLARQIGLLAAMGTRIVLLCGIWLVQKATDSLFHLSSLGIAGQWLADHTEVNEVSIRDLILLGGGLFLIQSSVREIHHKIEGAHDEPHGAQAVSFRRVIFQIAMLDIIFSLDSVITAACSSSPRWATAARCIFPISAWRI